MRGGMQDELSEVTSVTTSHNTCPIVSICYEPTTSVDSSLHHPYRYISPSRRPKMAMTLLTRSASSLALLWSRLKDLRASTAGRTTEQSLRWHFVKWQRMSPCGLFRDNLQTTCKLQMRITFLGGRVWSSSVDNLEKVCVETNDRTPSMLFRCTIVVVSFLGFFLAVQLGFLRSFWQQL